VKRGYFNCQNGGDVYEAHQVLPSRKTTFGSPKKSILKKSSNPTTGGADDVTADNQSTASGGAAVTGWSQRTVTTPRAESSSRGRKPGGLRKQSAVVPESADPTPRAALHQAADPATLESMEHTPSKYPRRCAQCIFYLFFLGQCAKGGGACVRGTTGGRYTAKILYRK
jgi:hypothetical protein